MANATEVLNGIVRRRGRENAFCNLETEVGWSKETPK